MPQPNSHSGGVPGGTGTHIDPLAGFVPLLDVQNPGSKCPVLGQNRTRASLAVLGIGIANRKAVL